MSDEHDHVDGGLEHDLPRLFNRRSALGILGGASAAAVLAACGGIGSGGSTTAEPPVTGGPPGGGPPGGGAPGGSTVTVGDGEIPEETNGPYPADGTNNVNILTESGVVRSDIRSSFGSASGTAPGLPLTVDLQLVDVSSATDVGSVVAGAAIYVWHCDANGDYSMYSQAVVNENYLRGVQETDADGRVGFVSVFPGAYPGRWPHIHFEVYPSLADATTASNLLRTSQLAFPEDVCAEVYSDGTLYPQSARNLERTPLSQDNVFSDGYSLQMASVTGSTTSGYTATLRIPI